MSDTGQEGVKPTNCPACGKFLDRATCPVDQGARPTEGDLTCCIGCAAILVFDADGEPVSATPAELYVLDSDVRRQLEAMQRAIRKVRTQS